LDTGLAGFPGVEDARLATTLHCIILFSGHLARIRLPEAGAGRSHEWEDPPHHVTTHRPLYCSPLRRLEVLTNAMRLSVRTLVPVACAPYSFVFCSTRCTLSHPGSSTLLIVRVSDLCDSCAV
jgi:hypothetical protein